MDDWDAIYERLEELQDIQVKLDVLNDRMEELDVCADDLEAEIARCRYMLGALEEAEREELRREYERSVADW